MKYKLICIAVAVVTILSAVLLHSAQNGLVATRVHQHLEAQPKQESPKDQTEFTTHLPILSLEADEAAMEYETVAYENGYKYNVKPTTQGKLTVRDSETYNNHPSDAPTLSEPVYVRLRGASSVRHDKHNYKITFIHEDGTENKDVSLLGMEPYDEWALHGPFLDRSLIRNYLCMNVGGQIMPFTPDVRFCELFVNGQYRGIYVAMETVARAKGRVEINAYEAGSVTSSYIVRLDRYAENPEVLNVFGTYTYRIGGTLRMEVLYPGERLTPQVKTYIERDFSAFEKALYSYDYDDVSLGYRHYVDVQSFVDYAVINEFFQNYDAGSLSTYFYKDNRGKIHVGPLWDYNNSLDSFNDPMLETEGLSMIFAPHFEQMVKDEYFVGRFIQRYRELRKTILSEEYLLAYIDQVVAYLGDAVDRNFEVWGYTFNVGDLPSTVNLEPEYRNPEGYRQAVQQLKDYIIWRGAWLDEHVDVLWQHCHESAVKKYNP